MEVCVLLVVVLYALEVSCAEAGGRGLASLRLGSSLSVEEEGDFLISPSGAFSGGFYKVGTNAYCFSIWFTNSVNKTVVWMANRDQPVNGIGSKLTPHRNGNLLLTDSDGSFVWSTNTFSEQYVEVQLLETGNLVLINQRENIIWESFDFPTDTILPNQPFLRNMTLVSMRSPGTYLSGYYNFKFDDNNVLNLIYNGPLVSSVYWPDPQKTVFVSWRNPYNSSRLAFLDDLGSFHSSDNLNFKGSNFGVGLRRRLTLDYDGILRLYSLEESTGLWEISWWPGGVEACTVHGLCGAYGICSYNPLPTCSCPDGFSRYDPSDWTKGCSPQFDLNCNATELDFVMVPSTDYTGNDLDMGVTGISFEACRKSCLNDCNCQGFGYSLDGQGHCSRKGSLLNGDRRLDSASSMHIKVRRGAVIPQAEQRQARTNNSLNCSAAEVMLFDAVKKYGKSKEYMKYLISFVTMVGVIEMVCIGLGWWFFLQKHVHEELVNMGYIALAMDFRRFTFSELKRATQNFKQEIGKGGFGTVYKGILNNERVVAVKRLEGILQGEAEFWAEVSIIGKLNHQNLVKMWGFCAEDEQKLLVYDYMENGSLDKILFSDTSKTLDWDQRYNIALGTAKGLSYIHEECLEWVVHCDVKPENILLDDKLEPKVADFGMSKLFKDDVDSGFSRVRGTRGYLAPEWMRLKNINVKADVYSYGIVVLELLTGRRASGFQLQEGHENEHDHLVKWARERIERGRLGEVIDPRLLNYDNDGERLERLARVALLCVGEERDSRPAMSEVVQLLIGYNQ
ncbi:putative receptor protein kinase ZmPK1 [Diospyros lotus]|uniref:putative receptor protein kinase ZmPK1 n=1 Tax=Diospyros lotus TaxID=55363 RepID=UPI002255D5FC|nr:putative receptor protein kinase ZmPK1 [Diospyros lotus]